MTRYSWYLFFLLLSLGAGAQPRTVLGFNSDWKFQLGDDSAMAGPGYNDTRWRRLVLPHDWSIESDFSKAYPATNQGGALPGGIGWYRKSFVLPQSANGRQVSIEFDGVYRNSEVWINGILLGKRPNGYLSFAYDLTPYLKPAPGENTLAVRVDNSAQPNSRWYSGSGIYRSVQLVITGKTFVERGGSYITTPAVSAQQATVHIETTIKTIDTGKQQVSVVHSIYDPAGRLVKRGRNIPVTAAGLTATEQLLLHQPLRWHTDRPALYRLKTQVFRSAKLVDETLTSFGIRSFRFDPAKGFFLNGQPQKIKGVCMHHDLGILGAAFNEAAAQRQLRLLKAMGCNAIRTAHNPPASEWLDLCDRMGFLVMDEAFDMWQKRKNKFDYHLDFKEWATRDIAEMVLRDRNHPSVFSWSIGNEIREQFDSSGIALARDLAAAVKRLDTTRPVVSALTETDPGKNFIYRSGALDLLGFNYKLYDYATLPGKFPGQNIIAAETVSALATRGVYDQPSDSMRVWPPDAKPFTAGKADMTVSAYDHVYAYWGATHEQSLIAANRYPFISGSFVWSGFDFLGEPVPYAWPARSAYYGIIDLAGFPKDVYYLYQSQWTRTPVLHIFPHWNWQPGQMVDVWAYYNQADEVELFLNGRSLGKQHTTPGKLHVMWRVPFEPGTLKAVSRKAGKTVLVKEISTAGRPARIELAADKIYKPRDGNNLVYITARITDSSGNTVPGADNTIRFSVTGDARIAGSDNGYQADSSSLQKPVRKAWKGLVLALVRITGKKGNSTLTATSPGLPIAYITLKANR
ncbi:DUF4982 domain-containing protein [Sediminibacterium sp. WSJ-3]|nr:DUF4982 domain-containing protein [Sediminibacterium soli]